MAVKLSSAGMVKLLKSDRVLRILMPHAERSLATARANAPVKTGTYRDSIHLEVVEHPTRVVVQVVADAPHAHLVEANTGNLARSL